MSYSQIDLSERREIAYYLNEKHYSIRMIAKLLSRSPSTISREITKNRLQRSLLYDPRKANHRAYVRKKYSKFQKSRILSDMKLRQYIEKHLRLWWSPQEVAGRIGHEFWLESTSRILDASNASSVSNAWSTSSANASSVSKISKTSIYSYLRSAHGQMLAYDLDLHKIQKKSKVKKLKHAGMKLEDRIFIDERPTSVNERLHYGDYEGDFIVSGKDGSWALLVLHERKSRFILVRKLESRSIEEVHQVIARMLRPIRNLTSLTLDNDIAFRRHAELSEMLKAPIYFCHPYHSWEKGWVEFSNRLIREYIPKGTDISKIPEDYILDLEVRLNNRPRQILGFKTPLEVMKEHDQFHMFATYPCTTNPIS